MMDFKARWELIGGHVHLTVFAGEQGKTYANIGMLMMRPEEFQAFRERFKMVYESRIPSGMRGFSVPDHEEGEAHAARIRNSV
jgi:hypothetical protein